MALVPHLRRLALAAAAAVSWQAPLAAGPHAHEAPPTAPLKQVTWAVYDAAPYMMTDGPEAGRGISDQIRGILTDRMTDYAHNTLVVPFPRFVSSLKQGAEWCFVGGVRTQERDAFAYFSRPTGMFYPLRVHVRAAQRARFEALGPLSPELLLQGHPELRTSVLRNRAVTPKVDEALRRSRVSQVHSEFGEAFRMLRNDRLDYLFEFANIATYYAAASGEPAPWISLPLAETPEPVFSRVMCARTPWGRAVIDRIDAILPAERGTERYRRIVEAWSAEADLAKLRTVYDASFLSSE